MLAQLLDRLHDRTIHLTTINDTISNSGDHAAGVGNTGDRAPFAYGGHVGYLAGGGVDPYSRGTDTVRAMLFPDEFVVKRDSAQSVGGAALEYINRHGQLPPQQQAPSVVQPIVNVYLDGRDVTANMVSNVRQEIASAVSDTAYMRPGVA